MKTTSYPSPIGVEYLQGIHVLDSVLWLDAVRQADLCFVSHATTGPIHPHHKILVTKATAALIQRRKRKTKMLVCPYYRRFSLGELDIELAPSGYMPGSAQICVSREQNRLVYTGPFRLTDPLTGQPIPVLECDTLVIQATLEQASEVQPDPEKIENDLLHWTKHQLASGNWPVFYTPPLGEAQELVHILTKGGLEVSVHDSIFRICRKYEALGVRLADIGRLGGKLKSRRAVVLPTGTQHAKTLARLGRTSLAMIMDRTSKKDNVHKTQMDMLFPLTMQASLQEQMQYVQASHARKIHVTGPAAEAFAAQLRSRGFCAWSLRPPVQMDFFRAAEP